MEASARFSPSLVTITSAIFCAAPVLIRVPAKIPDVIILRTDDIILCEPDTIVATVVTKPPPPMRPPINAPSIKLYAGCTFL